MGASQASFEVLAAMLRRAPTPADADALLDRWHDIRTRATEWDALQWGFHPDRWCRRERAELARRAGSYTGPPPMDHEGTTL